MKKIYIILILVAIAWVTFVTFTLTAGMSIFGGAAACYILYLSIKDSPTTGKDSTTGKDKTFRGDVTEEFIKNRTFRGLKSKYDKYKKKKDDEIENNKQTNSFLTLNSHESVEV